MKRCITCEGLLEDRHFSANSPICHTCVQRLHSEFQVDYTPPERKTQKEATTNLILAVKEQAEKDEASGFESAEDHALGGPVKAWYHNWVESEPWERLWTIMRQSEESLNRQRSQINRRYY